MGIGNSLFRLDPCENFEGSVGATWQVPIGRMHRSDPGAQMTYFGYRIMLQGKDIEISLLQELAILKSNGLAQFKTSDGRVSGVQ